MTETLHLGLPQWHGLVLKVQRLDERGMRQVRKIDSE